MSNFLLIRAWDYHLTELGTLLVMHRWYYIHQVMHLKERGTDKFLGNDSISEQLESRHCAELCLKR